MYMLAGGMEGEFLGSQTFIIPSHLYTPQSPLLFLLHSYCGEFFLTKGTMALLGSRVSKKILILLELHDSSTGCLR
ncbi:hypothetical protein GcM3_135017 [Golovinomyces cichoracearum]|uniref:Uncharacterized protein n=1 Tax=Golovinomyces cichoracearum TaxID=62708 RepID=A0A420I2P7_9PEZI|nr:hypothetical protein GcM3_135017 [Golovinomyces cichoracearum]